MSVERRRDGTVTVTNSWMGPRKHKFQQEIGTLRQSGRPIDRFNKKKRKSVLTKAQRLIAELNGEGFDDEDENGDLAMLPEEDEVERIEERKEEDANDETVQEEPAPEEEEAPVNCEEENAKENEAPPPEPPQERNASNEEEEVKERGGFEESSEEPFPNEFAGTLEKFAIGRSGSFSGANWKTRHVVVQKGVSAGRKRCLLYYTDEKACSKGKEPLGMVPLCGCGGGEVTIVDAEGSGSTKGGAATAGGGGAAVVLSADRHKEFKFADRDFVIEWVEDAEKGSKKPQEPVRMQLLLRAPDGEAKYQWVHYLRRVCAL